MNEPAVQALESRIVMAAGRMRALAAEVERLQTENSELAHGSSARARSARESLGLALAELRED